MLALKGNGTIYLNKDQIREDAMLTTLTSVMDARSEKVLFLKANEGLDYGYVLRMMDVCRRAGADEVALITREKT